MKTVEMYTDGACRGNPGPGGWGVLLRNGEKERTLYGGDPNTTNNRMELTAAIEGLSLLSEPCRVELTTDSEYVRRGITEWMPGWKQRNWRTASRKPVANRDLWERLDAIASEHDVRWHWVRGHSGHAENERVDALANQGIDEMQSVSR
ncbi:ribonuclease HI [Spiribacter sp. C176]|uniref:Ribonuclease H n=1 Tax=Spiribacter salilacus TaxID=2664894 RepID=A0A6N7QTS2_9GAMM|nr:ribonuclease HI [Spiribacter salilacus]MRH78783.1 ribonuclease HI [Spiribacter salilacus]